MPLSSVYTNKDEAARALLQPGIRSIKARCLEQRRPPCPGAVQDKTTSQDCTLLCEPSPPTPLGETDKRVLSAQEPRWFGTSKPWNPKNGFKTWKYVGFKRMVLVQLKNELHQNQGSLKKWRVASLRVIEQQSNNYP